MKYSVLTTYLDLKLPYSNYLYGPLLFIYVSSVVKVFNEIDADGNGFITAEEVVAGYKKLGRPLTLDQAKAIITNADSD